MKYKQFIKFLLNLTTADVHMKLSNMEVLLKALKNPEKKYKTIHIAGTNGKGSVSTKIANALHFSGYKTALYTSPHIASFRERIVIDGNLISKKDILKEAKIVLSIAKQKNISPSFFEVLTLIAFNYFARQKVDFAVIETGLGGRLDATNALYPILSIISSIGYDHMYVLGDTLEKIAFEKAGIIKPKIPLVIGPKANFQTIIKKAQELKCPIIKIKKTNDFFDIQNSLIAKISLKHLQKKHSISNKAIIKGIELRPKCRFEIFYDKGPKAVIFDVGHNQDAFIALFLALDQFFSKEKIRLIIGMSKDKDIKACLKIVASRSKAIHLIEAKSPRAASILDMKRVLLDLNYKDFFLEKNIFKAMHKAQKLAMANKEILVVCGSFFIMRDCRRALGIKDIVDDVDLNEKHQSLR